MRILVGYIGRHIGGVISRTGPPYRTWVWWRFDSSGEVRARFREKLSERDDLSINVLELMAMAVGAWIFITESEMTPENTKESIFMRDGKDDA